MFVTLDKLRQHLNILPGECEEDNEYLIHIISAAEDATCKFLNIRSLSTLVNEQGYIPEDVEHSILILCGNWYNARESFAYSNVSKLPQSYEWIASLNRNYNEPF